MISDGGPEALRLEAILATTFKAYVLTELGALLSKQAALTQQIAELNEASDRINSGVSSIKEELGAVRSELDRVNQVIEESTVDNSALEALTAAVDRVQATADAITPLPPVETPGSTPGDQEPDTFPGTDEPMIDLTTGTEIVTPPNQTPMGEDTRVDEQTPVADETPVEEAPTAEAPVEDTVTDTDEALVPDETYTESDVEDGPREDADYSS